MQVSLLKPGSSELHRYIECFYILKRSAQEEPINYLTFPSVFSIVVISQHTRTAHHKQQLTITYDPETPLETKLVANFNKPVLVRYEGAANEITIYFKPLGLNAFLDEPLSTFQKEDYTDFKPFNRLSDLTYALDYFDQSHMTREFRALTGMPPKKFFQDIAHIDPEYISWMFLPHTVIAQNESL